MVVTRVSAGSRSPVRVRRRTLRFLVLIGAVAVLGAASTGVASASEEGPPPTGVYVCYDETTVDLAAFFSRDVPVPVRYIIVVTPSGVYLEDPPC